MKNLFLFFLFVVFVFGCSALKEVGSETVIEKSGSTPIWSSKPSSEEGEFIFITGEMTKAKDRSFGMNQAYADGLSKLMNTMQNNVRTQSSQALRGANLDTEDIGRFSEFAVAWISETKTISGVQNPETYWEKVETKTETGVSYNYNCYSQLKISKKDYNRSIEGAYENMKKKARELNNKKAEETANKLIDDLKKTIE
ncbi:MAG: hypothetical protein D4R68_07575 [Ignavibacteriales bacterium]|nr:MAG: hypothetical protein D4R68_07575 [Ignavibacteriales bacterium]